MINGQFGGVPALDRGALLGTERTALAAANDLNPWVVVIDAAETQVGHHVFERYGGIFKRNVLVLQLLADQLTIIGNYQEKSVPRS